MHRGHAASTRRVIQQLVHPPLAVRDRDRRACAHRLPALDSLALLLLYAAPVSLAVEMGFTAHFLRTATLEPADWAFPPRGPELRLLEVTFAAVCAEDLVALGASHIRTSLGSMFAVVAILVLLPYANGPHPLGAQHHRQRLPVELAQRRRVQRHLLLLEGPLAPGVAGPLVSRLSLRPACFPPHLYLLGRPPLLHGGPREEPFGVVGLPPLAHGCVCLPPPWLIQVLAPHPAVGLAVTKSRLADIRSSLP
mmetsp:Transcript_25378/g.49534  ORF Transcript_25378/g.49534 Transcript_25378/m.49534 type:complete len:251 (-) Transcript_25378:132-884(-)